jgi:hypothetical protein
MSEEGQKVQTPALPKRKWNSPVARVVCWKCKRWGVSELFRQIFNLPPVVLYRLRYPNGKKSPDYACQDHLELGLPPIGNQSLVPFQYEA